MQSHLSDRLDVPSLAARVGVSERSFYRKFTEATGLTPARYVQQLRLDAGRLLLTSPGSLKGIAGKVGFFPTRFAAAFQQRFRVAPSLFREVHGAASERHVSKRVPSRI